MKFLQYSRSMKHQPITAKYLASRVSVLCCQKISKLKGSVSGEMSIVKYQKKDKISSIKLFESEQIRSEWNESEQKWYFAIIDVIEVLTESNNPRRYWSDLKRKLSTEGFSQLYEIIVQLKMTSSFDKKLAICNATHRGKFIGKLTSLV